MRYIHTAVSCSKTFTSKLGQGNANSLRKSDIVKLWKEGTRLCKVAKGSGSLVPFISDGEGLLIFPYTAISAGMVADHILIFAI